MVRDDDSSSLSTWLQESKTDPLVSSIDGMFEKLDVWESPTQQYVSSNPDILDVAMVIYD